MHKHKGTILRIFLVTFGDLKKYRNPQGSLALASSKLRRVHHVLDYRATNSIHVFRRKLRYALGPLALFMLKTLDKRWYHYLGEGCALFCPDWYCKVASNIDSAITTLFSISAKEAVVASSFSCR